MKSWLIQRGSFKKVDKEQIQGFDSYIRLDYMGSSEFEWGAVPKSLNSIIYKFDKMIIVGTGIRDKDKRELFILCNNEKEQEAIECVVSVSKEPYGYKEWCDMKFYLDGSRKTSNDFWWDIQNDWMACTGRDRIDLIKYSIEKVIEKRKTLEAV